jgi:hypothetical protein
VTPRQARAYRISILQEQIDHLLQYHFWLETSIKRGLIESQRDLQEKRGTLGKDKKHELKELYSDEQQLLKEVFVRNLRYSTVVSAAILLEVALNAICKGEQRRFGYRVELTDMKDKGIYRARGFLRKVCGSRFPDETAEWKRMQVLAELRNVIAHANGDLTQSTNEPKVRNMIRDTPGVTLRRDQYLQIASRFVKDTLEMMKEFLSLVHRSIPAGVRAA